MALRNKTNIHVNTVKKPISSSLGKILIFMILGIMCFFGSTCVIDSADFSDYEDVDLLQDSKLSDSNWELDGTSAADRDSAGNLASDYLALTRIDTLDYGMSGSRYSASENGFDSATSLYSGLPSAAYLDDGTTTPPVYRLEVLNLFINGDFEDSSGSTTGFTAVDNSGFANVNITSDPSSTSSRDGSVLTVNLTSDDSLNMDFSQLVSTYSSDTSALYNLSFLFRISQNIFYMQWDPDETSDRLKTIQYPTNSDTSTTSDVWCRFPFSTAEKASTISLASGQSILQINPQGSANDEKRVTATPLLLDNIQISRYDTGLGLRLQVPYRLVDTNDDDLRPPLISGGTYTLSFYVRNDPTAADDDTKYPNRFQADYLALDILDDTDSGSNENPITVTTFSQSSDWDSWTEISISITNLLNTQDLSSAAASDELLELYISPSNVRNDRYLIPGAILLTTPRLYWSPN